MEAALVLNSAPVQPPKPVRPNVVEYSDHSLLQMQQTISRMDPKQPSGARLEKAVPPAPSEDEGNAAPPGKEPATLQAPESASSWGSSFAFWDSEICRRRGGTVAAAMVGFGLLQTGLKSAVVLAL